MLTKELGDKKRKGCRERWPKRGYIASGGEKLSIRHLRRFTVYTASLVHDEAGTAGAVGRLRSWVHPMGQDEEDPFLLLTFVCGCGRWYFVYHDEKPLFCIRFGEEDDAR